MKEYAVVVGGAFLAAVGLARLGLEWQHQHWEQRYSLMPINHVRLYFVPLAALGCFTVALFARRPSTWLGLAWIAGLGCSLASALFWHGVGTELGGNQAPEAFREAVAQRLWSQVLVGALCLGGLVSFAAGILESVRAPSRASSEKAG